jgi:S1-C subfamily serine protease
MTSTEPSALVALSGELSAAVARVAPSLVYVDGSPRRDATGIAWNEHTIVTVDHALDRDDDVELVLDGGRRVAATVAGRDPSTDLAILRTGATFPAIARAGLDGAAVGQLVLAAGRDEDGRLGASFGVLSALDGPWQTWRGGEIERLMRPDLTLYSGFSGGPLLDAAGAVLGINTWGLSRRTALTIPLETIARVVGQLESRGSIARGYLGVALQDVRLPDALRAAQSIAAREAALVVDVALGDVLLALGEITIEGAGDLQRALGFEAVGTRQALTILRGGTRATLEITIGERPNDDRE